MNQESKIKDIQIIWYEILEVASRKTRKLFWHKLLINKFLALGLLNNNEFYVPNIYESLGFSERHC